MNLKLILRWGLRRLLKSETVHEVLISYLEKAMTQKKEKKRFLGIFPVRKKKKKRFLGIFPL